MNDRAKALHQAADYAAFYADERMRLCTDSILHDPILNGTGGVGALAKSRELQIEGTINSAAYHAANDIAEHLRALAKAAEAPVGP